jgi:hypothetical protein
MYLISLKDEIKHLLDKLSPADLQAVLAFTQNLKNDALDIYGIEGESFVERAKAMGIDAADLATMRDAIDEDCERIDWDGWA